jgi:membrane-bound lytic murein transglycosylase D
MRILLSLFFAAAFYSANAQAPQVPHKMQFANMTLTIRDDARREIQKDVDALTQSPKHFNIKAERARTYFPLIEKVFKEEGVPEDFKYLVLQESALIADAVSVSNAVGFWQFKDFTALEMGLRIDREIDERLNIVSSSRAAARYIKKNNTFFDNWIYALQAYQMGAGGVMRSVKESQSGDRHMEITSKTYWYVKKYLAHKVAFEDAVKGAGQIQVLTYETQNRRTLADLAKEVTIDEAELKNYNKWAKTGSIPDDRIYAVLIPVNGNGQDIALPALPVSNRVPEVTKRDGEVRTSVAAAANKNERRKINGILTIQAVEGDNPTKLAARAGMDLSMFLKWNDISISERTEPGRYYLLGKKRARVDQAYHKVVAGETLWDISQEYGLQLKKLKRYNKIESDRDLKPGMTLWLSASKPRNSDKVIAAEVVEVDKSDTFTWTADPAETQVKVSAAPPTVMAPEPVITTDTLQTSQEPADSTQTLQPPTNAERLPADTLVQPVIEVVVPENEKKDQHVVQQGETLYAIARQYNVGVMDLVNWNQLDLQAGIRPGQVLKLAEAHPVAEGMAAPAERREIEHEVRATDTLYSIARKYDVTIKELMEWNNKKGFTLSVGEKLKVMQK